MLDVVVDGLICRDLVVTVEELPASGSTPVIRRIETLGGAANQAVGARQLGLSAGVVGVVGEDAAAELVLDQAGRDGIDVSAVVHRGTTPLVVALVDAEGRSQLLEHISARLTPGDVRAAAHLLGSARAVLVDLQQPDEAVAEAVRCAAGRMIVLDGAPTDPSALGELLPSITVLRADHQEAAAYFGRPLEGVDEVLAGARELVAKGPSIVALAAGADGNVLAWKDGQHVYPLLDAAPVDPTGGGDAFVVGLVHALLSGADPRTAGWQASAAAALTIGHLGGRPRLDRDTVVAYAAEAAGT